MFYDVLGNGPHITPKEIRGEKRAEIEVKEASISNPFKKPFMPTSWKWFRTSGAAKPYTFIAPRGATTTLEVRIPKQYTPFIVAGDGTVFPSTGTGLLKIEMEGDTRDYFTLGDRVAVTMLDAEPNGTVVEVDNFDQIPVGARTPTLEAGKLSYYSTPPNPPTVTTFPSLAFKSEGVTYSLDWNRFAQKRRLSRGAFGQEWGYPRAGHPTMGLASSYDRQLTFTWNRSFKWWWLVVAAGVGYGIKKLFDWRKV